MEKSSPPSAAELFKTMMECKPYKKQRAPRMELLSVFLVLLQLCKGLPLMEDADRLPIAEDEVDDLGRCRQQPGEGVQQV